MANAVIRFWNYTELPFKFKAFIRKVYSSFDLMFRKTPKFNWDVLTLEELDKSLPVYERMAKYELVGRGKEVICISGNISRMKLNKILMELGFVVEVIWGEAKYSDGAAVRDIGIPPIYSWFWNATQFVLTKLPLPKVHFILPAFGRKRLHLRLFHDKENKCWYITSHVDNTNLLSFRPWDFKDAVNCHLFDKIEGDYELGPKLVIELLEKRFRAEGSRF